MARFSSLLIRWKAKLFSVFFSPSPQQASKSHWPEFGIEFLIEFGLALYQLGAEQMGLPPNFEVGLTCWIVAICVAVRMFWIFPPLLRILWPGKVLVTAVVMILLVYLGWRPVSNAYLEKHPLSGDAMKAPILPSRLQPPVAPAIERVLVPPPRSSLLLAHHSQQPTGGSPSRPVSPPSAPQSAGNSSGSVVGNITQGPGSIAQIGGTGNTAIIATPPQRVMAPEQKSAFVAALGIHPRSISVYCYSTDKEGCTYAQDFFSSFKQVGWDVGKMVGIIFANPVDSQVYITVQNVNARPEGFIEVLDAFRSLGLPLHLLIQSDMKPEELRVTVGRTPPD